ncbi:MAG: hypothetical protein WCV58_03660 [Patescibacteria group bacterium]
MVTVLCDGSVNKVPPQILAEGVVTQIWLDPAQATEVRLNGQEAEAVLFIFRDNETGFYLPIHDHRKKTIEVFKSEGSVDGVFNHVPCLGTMRRGRGQYLSLVDVDDPKTDIVGRGELILAQGPFSREDREECRVVNNATHIYTHISLLEKK